MKRSTFLLLLALSLISCAAPTTTIKILNTPKANLSAYAKIAIADFQGNTDAGRLVSGLLTTELAKSGKFQIIERAELERIMKEHALEMSGIVDEQTAHECGLIVKVSALIFGEVSAFEAEDKDGARTNRTTSWTGDYKRDATGNIIYWKSANGQLIPQKEYRENLQSEPYLIRTAFVAAGFRVVDIATGQLVASKTARKSYSATAEGLAKIEKLPSKPEILDELAEQAVHEFLAEIAPHYTQHTMKLEKGNKLGIQLAESGLWQKAQEIFADEVKAHPNRPEAHYNLGVTLEAQGKLKEAENEYIAALALKPKDLYVQVIRAIRQLTEPQ
ncbi:tetratricopeptide repeat protein [bacterium]|nr:tetratricopeptide repeat protein [bacterium]